MEQIGRASKGGRRFSKDSGPEIAAHGLRQRFAMDRPRKTPGFRVRRRTQPG
jgi:hypothetical protein